MEMGKLPEVGSATSIFGIRIDCRRRDMYSDDYAIIIDYRFITTEKYLTKISSRAGVEPPTFRSPALHFSARLCPPPSLLTFDLVTS